MKRIIILAVVIAALSSAYFFVIFLPSQKLTRTQRDKQAFLFDKQTECMKICQNLYEDDNKSLSESSVFNPRYAYNDSKNTCFYSGGWISANPSSLTKRVVNCQTNKEVLTFMTINNKVFTSFCDTCVGSSEEYDKKEKEYIGN
jgi:hypothetical protein